MAKIDPFVGVSPSVIIKSCLDILHEPGEVFEVRIPKTKAGTISGYFNDTTIAGALIKKEDGQHQAIYATVNPVKPDLLARNHNRFERGSQTTSTDSEITKRRWFLLDLDPIRATGISSTAGEIQQAQMLADEVISWLASLGWPEPLVADSGNGVHIMYRVDEPNDDSARIDFEMATKMIASIWSTDKVIVDTTSFNASRVWKVYGTMSRKGSSTAERPHRMAKLINLPKTLELVSRGQISNVAGPLRDAKPDEYRDQTGEFIEDMPKWLLDRGCTVTSGPRPMFGSEGQKWTISRCPFNPDHQNPMVGLVNNRPVFRCLHNSCSAFKWKEFREKVDPTYKDPETVRIRLVEWGHGSSEELEGYLAQAAGSLGRKLEKTLHDIRKEIPRERFSLLQQLLQSERRKFVRETIGENNEKGNLVGLINRVRGMQAEGVVPMYWTSDFDFRVRAGILGDIAAPKFCVQDEISLLVRFHASGDTWVKQTHCAQVIQHLADEFHVNPLKIHLKQKVWDGIPRLDDWLPHYMGTKDSEYTRAVGRKWLISAVARAMEPGCQADHMLIFEGAQGIGKSQALRILGGQFYSEYSGGVNAQAQRDMVAVLIGKMIVEMSELATLRRADMESLKAILTKPNDDARLSYERDAKTYPRTCVFAGTTNEVGQAYIADQSGARRFWPTHCGELRPVRIDLLRLDVDQLWAEAVWVYDSGEDWWTIPVELVAEEQCQRQLLTEDVEPWFAKIRGALTDPDSYANELFHIMPEFINGQPTARFVVRSGDISRILGILIGVDTARQSSIDVGRVQKVLRSIGFKKVRPNKGWKGGTYAYDLTKEVAPHLWPSIDLARTAIKFPKHVEEDQT